MQKSYIQCPMYMTPLTLKLKLREKSDFRVWTKGPRHAKTLNCSFIGCKVEFMGLESISHTTNMTQTSYIQRPMYMTPLILKLKLREKSDFRVWTEGPRHAKIFNCSFISCKVEFMGYESISHTTDMTQTFYIQRRMYMTPLIIKLKLREKSDFRWWIEGLRHMLKYAFSFVFGLNLDWKAFHKVNANLLVYPTSYVYDPTIILKLKLKEKSDFRL